MTPDSEKMLAEMYLRQERMMQEIRALQAQLDGHPAIADGWATPSDAVIALKPEGIKSAERLKRLRLAGAFSEARGEIENRSEGNRPTWYYHIPKCRKALQRYFRSLKTV